jgi:hypothetical protein
LEAHTTARRTELSIGGVVPNQSGSTGRARKINGPGQHHQSGGDDVLASPATSGEPGTGDHAGDLDAEVITALRHLTEMINQRLQFGSSRSQQGFAVELGGHGLVFGGHSFSLPTLPTGRFILVASLYPGVSFAWATTWFCG